MVNPRTVNAGIIVPLTGADVDLWGEVDVNPNMVAIDGLISGIQTVALAATDVILTAPAGFSATPSPGPTQSQNRVLRFTGVLTNDVIVTLPLPGVYVIENLTTGAHTIRFRGATFTEQACVDQGVCATLYNDGANVRFVDLGRVAQMDFWAGISSLPNWVAQCTVQPYLLCDGTIYNYSQYPYLAAKLQGKFGGNGITTFAVPDLRGRVPLAYDGTGARITAAGSGINGQTIGASADNQSVTLNAAQLPANIPYSDPRHSHTGSFRMGSNLTFGALPYAGSVDNTSFSYTTDTSLINITINPGGGALHTNVQPALVTGVWVIKT